MATLFIAVYRKGKIELENIEDIADNVAPTDHLQRLLSQSVLLLHNVNAICMQSLHANIGRRTCAMVMAKTFGMQYFEITKDDFQGQIDNAIRSVFIFLTFFFKFF